MNAVSVHRHGVIVNSNRNRVHSITSFLVIVILVLKFHVIAIAIEYIAKVIAISNYAISNYFMIIAFVKHTIWSLHLVLNTGCVAL